MEPNKTLMTSFDDSLRVIDLVIQRSEEYGSKKIRKKANELLKTFSENILIHLDKKYDVGDENLESLIFDKNFSHQEKRFVAVCLLRLISVNDYCLNNRKYSIFVYSLFDDALPDIYKKLNIKLNDQGYEKITKLRDHVPIIEKELDDVIGSLLNLKGFKLFRTNFLRKFNTDYVKAIIFPFLPKDLTTYKLNDFFNVVEEYISINNDTKLHYLDILKKHLNNLKEELKNYKTKYNQIFIFKLLSKIELLIEEDIGTSSFCKPANLLVKRTEKKYPLGSTEKKEFNVSFLLVNEGPGFAYNVSVIAKGSDLEIIKSNFYLGSIEKTSIIVDIPVKVQKPDDNALMEIEIEWLNYDGSKGNLNEILELKGQKHNFSWEALENEEAYSLEPVETEEELYGRKEVLSQLIAKVRSNFIGSSFIYGQKRVGKTSLVKTLSYSLKKIIPKNLCVVYIERGEYNSFQEMETIKNLGKRIVEKIGMIDSKIHQLKIPDFDKSQSPHLEIEEYLKKVIEINPELKIVIILDEFDELSIKIYRRGPIGDAFFGTIRSISGNQKIGIVLVGGENMVHVNDWQGHALNKFQQIQLNYFDKREHWSDFQNLVRKPVAKWFEVTDSAIVLIYEKTAGNPFFTKLICNRLFKLMVQKRDSHITENEITETLNLVNRLDLGSNKFQHFWNDGIFETSIRFEEKTIRRRKTLLTIAELNRQNSLVTKENILKLAKDKFDQNEDVTENELREFIQRQILFEVENEFKFVVPIFQEWLINKGVGDIITTFSDMDEFLKRKKKEEDARIQSQEILSLLDTWGSYKGKTIAEDKLRVWLEQFGDNFNQRLIFNLLKSLKFYSNDSVRQKMKEAYGIVTRNLVLKIEEGKRKSGQILISYIDGIGKSGATYAKLFADENNIYSEYVVAKGDILESLQGSRTIDALVFVDDFIGTGESAINYYKELSTDVFPKIQSNLKIFFIVIVGYQEAKSRIQEFFRGLNMDFRIHICDELDDTHRAFSKDSKIIKDANLRSKTENLCHLYGSKLVKDNSLGFGNCQSLVVFENSCPNNTLPILWAEGKVWRPLFKRL